MHFTDSSKREDERESQAQTQAETQEKLMDNSIIICIKFQEGSKQYNRMPLFFTFISFSNQICFNGLMDDHQIYIYIYNILKNFFF